MKKYILVLTLLAVLATGTFVFNKQNKDIQNLQHKELVVYAYSSFVASWGVGAELQKVFQERTGATLKLVDVGDTSLMISKMEKEGLQAADVWLGMDQSLAEEAAVRFQWWQPAISNLTYAEGFPAEASQIKGMIPFDWAPLAFIFNSKKMKMPSYKDILGGKFKRQVTAPDPTLSPLGLELIRWLAGRNDGNEPIEKLKSLKVADFLFGRSWSQSYGLFQKGEALLAWSFITSPVYHWLEEKDESFQPVTMDEGHPYIVEYFAIPEDCSKKDLAQKFVEMMLGSESQRKIMNKNFMYPIRDGIVPGTRFAELPKVKLSSALIDPNSALALWKTVR